MMSRIRPSLIKASGIIYLAGEDVKNSTFEKASPIATRRTGTMISKNN